MNRNRNNYSITAIRKCYNAKNVESGTFGIKSIIDKLVCVKMFKSVSGKTFYINILTGEKYKSSDHFKKPGDLFISEKDEKYPLCTYIDISNLSTIELKKNIDTLMFQLNESFCKEHNNNLNKEESNNSSFQKIKKFGGKYEKKI